MPSPTITYNEKAAAGTSCGGLDFVWTTTTPSNGKDDDNGYIRRNSA